MPSFSLTVTEGQPKAGLIIFITLVEARAQHVAIKEAAWLFQSHAGVAVGANMMQPPPKSVMKTVHH